MSDAFFLVQQKLDRTRLFGCRRMGLEATSSTLAKDVPLEKWKAETHDDEDELMMELLPNISTSCIAAPAVDGNRTERALCSTYVTSPAQGPGQAGVPRLASGKAREGQGKGVGREPVLPVSGSCHLESHRKGRV